MNIRTVSQQNTCRGCGVCASICPVNAIEMRLDRHGLYYADLAENLCIQCDKCATVCSVLQTKPSSNQAKAIFYAYNKNPRHRLASSSGGAIGALVQAILAQGYQVMGAAYNYKTQRVCHTFINSLDEYYDFLAGSKYLPSYTVDAFRQLATKSKVCVIGTPCQISALRKAYPNKDILFIDFRCYGVCGYTLWDKYIASIQQHFKNQKNIRSINFHSKLHSWLKWGIHIRFEDGTEYFKPKTADPFGKIFSGLGNAGENCLRCTLAAERSSADIRVEDAWQLSQYFESEDYKSGVSQVTVMTDRGLQIWSEASQYLITKDVGLAHAAHGCSKPPYNQYLNKLIETPDLSINEVIKLYNRTIPIPRRLFNWGCDLLFNVPQVHFFIKKLYRKLTKMDDV